MARHSTLEKLQLAIHGVRAPFACGGTFDPHRPVALRFKDGIRFEVVRAKDGFAQKNELKTLLEHCTPAPFGDGKKTRYDRGVRDALQLKAENGGCFVENFDPTSAGVLEMIRRELVPQDSKPLRAELYSVNVYTDGGHFAPHKDTPRGEDMLGTLVVCLPSRFWRGELVLVHQGVMKRFDWGRAIAQQKNPDQLHWAAFFGDVDHEIEKVFSGARVTLTYLLRGGGGPVSHDRSEEVPAAGVREAWLALLADESFLPEGGILGYPCCHLYHHDARFQRKQRRISRGTATKVHGRDHLVAASALDVGLNVSFHPYMFETCADEIWQLDRFPTDAEQMKLGRRMDLPKLEKVLAIRASSEQQGDFGVTWLEDPPASRDYSQDTTKDRDDELPAAAHLHSCEYCAWGYFGNESSEIDLYTYAALHIEIPPIGDRQRMEKEPAIRAAVKLPRSGKGAKKKR